MAFNIQKEKQELDRFLSWAALKYEMYEPLWEFACGDRILETYHRYMESQITSQNKLGAARQAFWANIRFCELFREYFYMNWEWFNVDAQYHTWRDYCVYDLEIQKSDSNDTDIYGKNEDGNFTLLWRKPVHGIMLERSRKYRTWSEPEDDYEEAF